MIPKIQNDAYTKLDVPLLSQEMADMSKGDSFKASSSAIGVDIVGHNRFLVLWEEAVPTIMDSDTSNVVDNQRIVMKYLMLILTFKGVYHLLFCVRIWLFWPIKNP